MALVLAGGGRRRGRRARGRGHDALAFRPAERVDGIDFYVGSDELGHIHLNGSIHLATSPRLCSELVAEGLGRPFEWGHGWTVASVDRLGVGGSVALFRRNYDRLRPSNR